MKRGPALRVAVSAALAATLLLVAIGLAGRLHPALDSFAHFRAHLSALGLLLAAALLTTGAKAASSTAALAAVAALTTVAPAYLASPGAPRANRTSACSTSTCGSTIRTPTPSCR